MVEIDLVSGERIEAELADGFLSRILGMRFRSEGKMLFTFRLESRPVIDMLFVPTELKLVFLDKDKQVVDIKEAVPWRLYRPEEPAKFLLESSEPVEVEKGDRLEFEI